MSLGFSLENWRRSCGQWSFEENKLYSSQFSRSSLKNGEWRIIPSTWRLLVV
jgi:hypothetical protein